MSLGYIGHVTDAAKYPYENASHQLWDSSYEDKAVAFHISQRYEQSNLSGRVCQKQVTRASLSDHITQILQDVMFCPHVPDAHQK